MKRIVVILLFACLVARAQTNVYTVVNLMPDMTVDTNSYPPSVLYSNVPPALTNITIGYTRPAAVFFHSLDGGQTWTQCTNQELVSIKVEVTQPMELFKTGAENLTGMWYLEN